MLPQGILDLAQQDLIKRSQMHLLLQQRGQNESYRVAVADAPEQDCLPTEA
ncbi:MAG: hypothetical protein MH252_09770 [Thermosynechococcaceae cyanobacterium MS004]|nr:hypothetical protein [Thermosynechococcaceae cyanobacterium MS004]